MAISAESDNIIFCCCAETNKKVTSIMYIKGVSRGSLQEGGFYFCRREPFELPTMERTSMCIRGHLSNRSRRRAVHH